MVQIKHDKHNHTTPLPTLFYIPYGSDKTQGSGKWTPILTAFYIPYGSDKTWNRMGNLPDHSSFISHMVQIKRSSVFLIKPASMRVLYPIWFR